MKDNLRIVFFFFSVFTHLILTAQCPQPPTFYISATSDSLCAPATITISPQVKNAAADGTVKVKFSTGQGGYWNLEYGVQGGYSAVETFSQPGIYTSYMAVTVVAASSTCTATRTLQIHVFSATSSYCNKVGLKENIAGFKILVFPNPVVESFIVQNADFSFYRNIVLYDLSGKQVCEWRNEEDIYYLPEELDPGIYFIDIIDEDQAHAVQKIVVQ